MLTKKKTPQGVMVALYVGATAEPIYAEDTLDPNLIIPFGPTTNIASYVDPKLFHVARNRYPINQQVINKIYTAITRGFTPDARIDPLVYQFWEKVMEDIEIGRAHV